MQHISFSLLHNMSHIHAGIFTLPSGYRYQRYILQVVHHLEFFLCNEYKNRKESNVDQAGPAGRSFMETRESSGVVLMGSGHVHHQIPVQTVSYASGHPG